MNIARRAFMKLAGIAPIAATQLAASHHGRSTLGIGSPLQGPQTAGSVTGYGSDAESKAYNAYENMRARLRRRNVTFDTGIEAGAGHNVDAIRSWSPAFRRIQIMRAGEATEGLLKSVWGKFGVPVPDWVQRIVQDDE